MKERLIVALDFDTQEKAEQMIEKLGDSVIFYKVGLELFLNSAGSILKTLSSLNKKVFLDLKFHDIPNTVAAASRFAAKDKSISMFNVHSSGCSEMIKQAVKAKRPDQTLIAVTALTSLDDDDIKEYFHTSLKTSEFALNLAKETKKAGADGVVCSALEASIIKGSCGSDFITVCPGIRFAETSDMGDQKRVLTPNEAIQNGADYLVVGRPITEAKNPKEAAEMMLKEMMKD